MSAAIRYARSTGDSREFEAIVECYRRVFAAPPWSEWKICTICECKWGTDEEELLRKEKFRHHDLPVVDFWPSSTVLADLKRQITTEASCWLAWDAQRLVGFCWGYAAEPEWLEKELELPELADTVEREFGPCDFVAYQDEIGVEARYRKQGIARSLFARRREDFESAGLRVAVSRTKTLPATVTYTWLKRMGYSEIAQYNDEDGRVILARVLD